MPNIFTRTISTLAYKLNPAWLHVSSYSDTPQAIPMNRSYKNYAKEGYKNSDTLYKCISYIIRNGAAIPPKLYTDATRQKEIEKHSLLDKLNNPNNEQSGVQYREAVLGYKLLAGNSFQYAIRAKNGPPDELWVLRPDRMQLLIAPRKGIIGYKHEDIEQPLDPANIAHAKYWNPDDDNETGMGMSPVEAAALNIDMQIAGKNWNLGLLQNGARPPGIWKVPVLMGKNEREKLEQKLNEKFAGAKAAGKSPLFDGGLDWKGTGLAPAQMDYLDSLKYNGGSIANIYNMAPQLVGDNSSTTYDNMEQAKVWSYTEAIFPELDDFYMLLNNWLVPMYVQSGQLARGAYLYYDKESVEVIQKVIQAQKDAQAERANQLWMDGLCLQNEARALAGLPETPEGNVWRIGAVLVPQGKLQEYAEQSLTTPAAPPPAMPEPLSGPGAQQPPLQGIEQVDNTVLDRGKPASSEQENEQKPPGDDAKTDARKFLFAPMREIARVQAKALDLETAEQKKAYMQSVEAQRERWYTSIEQRIAEYFDGERKAVKKAVESAALPETATIRAESTLKKHSDGLKDVLVKLYQDVGTDVGQETLKQFKAETGSHEHKGVVDDFLKLFGADLLVYLLQLAAQKVQQITESTRAEIQSALSDGVAAGESIPKLSKRIDDLYLEQIIPNRSKVIAATEVVSASNWSSQQAAKQSGLTLKKVWLATEDARTRPAHAEADGQEVDLDEPFDVDGEQLQYPGDPAGSAENVIRCRCTQFYRRVKVSNSSEDDTNKAREQRAAYKQFVEAVLI